MCGLTMRYAALYRFPAPERLFDRLWRVRRSLPTVSNLDPSSWEGRAAAALLNLTPPQSAAMSTWHPETKAASVAGHRLSLDLVGLGSPQCCPACLRESPHHRGFWLLAAVAVCPVHGTRLVRRCPACGRKPGWQGRGPVGCSDPACGFDLRDAAPEQAEEAEVSAAEMFLTIYRGRPHPGGLQLNDAIEAALTLGAHVSGIRRYGRLATLVRSPGVDLPAVLASGAALLNPWPAAWHAFLGEELGRRSEGAVMGGLAAAFGPVYGLVRKQGGWRTVLGGELARYAAGRREVVFKRGRLLGQAVPAGPAGEWLCVDDVAAMLEVPWHIAKRVARRLGWERAPGTVAGKYVVKASAVRELLAARLAYGELMYVKDAAGLLGISADACGGLVSAGLLPEVPVGHRIRRRLSIPRSEVDAILAAFVSAGHGLPAVDAPEEAHRYAGWRGAQAGSGTSALVAGVLSGDLRPVAVWSGATGIARYLFLHRTSCA